MLLQTLGWLPVSVLGYNWSLGCPAQMEISASKQWDESNLLHKETEGYTFAFLSKIDNPFRVLQFWVAQHFSSQVSLFFSVVLQDSLSKHMPIVPVWLPAMG